MSAGVWEGSGGSPLQTEARASHSTGAIRVALVGGAGLSIAIGFVAIAGWSLGLPVLTQFFSTRSAMQPLTALCALFAGVAVIQANEVRARHFPSIVFTIIVVVAASQTLIEYGFAIDLGTDHLLFAKSVARQSVAYPHPGRMAAPTAAAFLLIGTGLLLARAPGRFAGLLLSACATAVLILVTVALLGYFYMVAPLTGVLGFTQVSIPTALALGGLALGVLALRPVDGWVRLLIGNSVGATAARWLLPIIVVVPVAVASMALRGSEIGLYPAEFRLAFTTAVTIVLLAGLALWGAWQLDRLVAVSRTAETLRESEATLRAFFETDGLFAALVERRGEDARYIATNAAFAELFGRADLTGLSLKDVQSEAEATVTVDRLAAIQASGAPLSLERALDTEAGTRWFALTISPVTGKPSDPPRFAIAAYEITDRKRAEEQQELLKLELGHRLKNVLTVVQSVASQTLRQADDLPGANRALAARLAALGEATNLLTATSWESADLRTLIDRAAAAHGGVGERVQAKGPQMTLQPQVTLALALALHELATNATKYGSLSTRIGHVDVNWRVTRGTDGSPARFCLTWREVGGPEVRTPSRRGFGSRMIERSLAAYFRGEASIAYPPEGVVFTLNCPLDEAGSISELA
jgi:PAS domain S-box-containing protein